MIYTHIIWDFNGTLLDDVETAIKTINTLLIRRKMQTIDSVTDYHKVFCFPIIEFYKNLCFNLENESINDIASEWVEQYLINSQNAHLFFGVIEVLSAFKNKGISQIILSATEKEMLTRQVKQLGITNYFTDILGLDNIHASSKVDIAKVWKETEKPKKAVLIGDSTHDFEVAQSINVDCILIANGHQSKTSLQKCGVIVVNDIKETQRLIELN
jgi:phosphoglycolate phosphatase